MKNYKCPLFLFLFASFLVSAVSFAESEGVFLSQYVDEEIILDSSRPSIEPSIAAPIIESYINEVNPDRETKHPNDMSTKDLAKRIAGVSYCFHIDPFVYTALIHKESRYTQRAKSPTRASGFTQFTTVAMKEVNDQLGLRGSKYAQPAAISYFNELLTDDCLAKQGGFTATGANYVPLWEVGAAAKMTRASSSQATKMVEMLKDYPEYALIYGAILFKVNFSLVENGYKTGCISYKTSNHRPQTMKDKYKEVMMFYNGDGCATQKNYQADIMGKFYTGITGVAAK